MTSLPLANVKIGHYTDLEGGTGCTVVLSEEGAVAGVDVRGASPGSRETALLDPWNTVERVHGILLTGGSAFGLAAADGVMRYLHAKGVGYRMRAGPVPIVPAAVLYDLGTGQAVWPDAAAGYAACEAAMPDWPAEGSVGAGTGATVGKLWGITRAMGLPAGAAQQDIYAPVKGGIGCHALTLADGVTVMALVAVNAVGDILDPATGQLVAAGYNPQRGFLNGLSVLTNSPTTPPELPTHTTIGVVMTNGRLTKAEARALAMRAYDGLAWTVRPTTPGDGDTLFALSVGAKPANLWALSAGAAVAVSQAILRAVRAATSSHGILSVQDIASLKGAKDAASI